MAASSDPLAQTDQTVRGAVEEEEEEQRQQVRHKALRFETEGKVGGGASGGWQGWTAGGQERIKVVGQLRSRARKAPASARSCP